MREPLMWFGALLAMVTLPCLLAWTLKGNTSSRPVSFAIRLKAVLTTICSFDVDIQYHVPDGQRPPPTIEGYATPPLPDAPEGVSPDPVSAEGGDEP